jgi:phospholipase C
LWQGVRRYRDVFRAEGIAIVWERLEHYELKRRERGIGPEPGPRPMPSLPTGTDLLPQIEHIVVLMMENHSYDNYFGMLRGRGEG